MARADGVLRGARLTGGVANPVTGRETARTLRYATGTTSTATATVWLPPPRMTPFTGLTSP